MKRLFRIIVLHGAPKSSHTSTETYLVADSEEAVFAWIDEEKAYNRWTTEDGEDRGFRKDPEADPEPSKRERVTADRGDLEDEEGWEDAYYGVTKWGWERTDATDEDIAVLLKLKIAHEL